MNRPPSPEFYLLAACCRWPGDVRAVSAAAAPSIDWPRFLKLVRRHRVQGFAYRGLLASGVAVPAQPAAHLARLAQDQARASLACAADTVRFATMLDRAGVAPVFFKGATLAARAYDDLSIKQSADIDVLVPPEAVSRTLAAFAEAGYERILPPGPLSDRQFDTMVRIHKSVTLLNRTQRKLIDVHWRLSTNPTLLPRLAPPERVVLGETAVATLAFDDLALYLAVHGAGHGWARLKWLADFNALLAALTADALARLRARARQEGLDPSFESAIALCRELLGGLGGAPAPRLGVREKALMAIAHDLMRGPDEVAEQVTRPVQGVLHTTAATFFQKRSLKTLAVNLWLASFKRDDALLVPLPRGTTPLYLLVGPAMRIGRNAGRGVRWLASAITRGRAAQATDR